MEGNRFSVDGTRCAVHVRVLWGRSWLRRLLRDALENVAEQAHKGLRRFSQGEKRYDDFFIDFPLLFRLPAPQRRDLPAPERSGNDRLQGRPDVAARMSHRARCSDTTWLSTTSCVLPCVSLPRLFACAHSNGHRDPLQLRRLRKGNGLPRRDAGGPDWRRVQP